MTSGNSKTAAVGGSATAGSFDSGVVIVAEILFAAVLLYLTNHPAAVSDLTTAQITDQSASQVTNQIASETAGNTASRATALVTAQHPVGTGDTFSISPSSIPGTLEVTISDHLIQKTAHQQNTAQFERTDTKVAAIASPKTESVLKN